MFLFIKFVDVNWILTRTSDNRSLNMVLAIKEIKYLLAEVSESTNGSIEYHNNVEKLLTPEVVEAISLENTRMIETNGRDTVSRYDILTDFFVSVFCYPQNDPDGSASMMDRTSLPNQKYNELISSVWKQYTDLPSKYRNNNYTLLYASEQLINGWLTVSSE